ncbi:MAG TPA: hypothetical protein PKD92_07415 [Novosphingobium sp.]|nr:hypothetical protein [Novosphingobium sp.]HMP56384.1 hypothetical protein [Novosphingobium sp.]
MTELLVLGGSLLAVIALVVLTRVLGLGGEPRIRDADHARELANEALFGFEPVEIGLDKAGYGALLRDAAGRVLLLRRHGTHFAGRLLDRQTQARLDRNFLMIQPADRFFGTVTLNLGREAQVWAGSFRRLGA